MSATHAQPQQLPQLQQHQNHNWNSASHSAHVSTPSSTSIPSPTGHTSVPPYIILVPQNGAFRGKKFVNLETPVNIGREINDHLKGSSDSFSAGARSVVGLGSAVSLAATGGPANGITGSGSSVGIEAGQRGNMGSEGDRGGSGGRRRPVEGAGGRGANDGDGEGGDDPNENDERDKGKGGKGAADIEQSTLSQPEASSHPPFVSPCTQGTLNHTPVSSSASLAAPAPSIPANSNVPVPLSGDNITPTKRWVRLNSKVVSRRHARLYHRGNRYYLQDTMSSSGTFLKGRRLSSSGQMSQEFEIHSGDVIRLGDDFSLNGVLHRCVVFQVVIPSQHRESQCKTKERDDKAEADVVKKEVSKEVDRIWRDLTAGISPALRRLREQIADITARSSSAPMELACSASSRAPITGNTLATSYPSANFASAAAGPATTTTTTVQETLSTSRSPTPPVQYHQHSSTRPDHFPNPHSVPGTPSSAMPSPLVRRNSRDGGMSRALPAYINPPSLGIPLNPKSPLGSTGEPAGSEEGEDDDAATLSFPSQHGKAQAVGGLRRGSDQLTSPASAESTVRLLRPSQKSQYHFSHPCSTATPAATSPSCVFESVLHPKSYAAGIAVCPSSSLPTPARTSSRQCHQLLQNQHHPQTDAASESSLQASPRSSTSSLGAATIRTKSPVESPRLSGTSTGPTQSVSLAKDEGQGLGNACRKRRSSGKAQLSLPSLCPSGFSDTFVKGGLVGEPATHDRDARKMSHPLCGLEAAIDFTQRHEWPENPARSFAVASSSQTKDRVLQALRQEDPRLLSLFLTLKSCAPTAFIQAATRYVTRLDQKQVTGTLALPARAASQSLPPSSGSRPPSSNALGAVKSEAENPGLAGQGAIHLQRFLDRHAARTEESSCADFRESSLRSSSF